MYLHILLYFIPVVIGFMQVKHLDDCQAQSTCQICESPIICVNFWTTWCTIIAHVDCERDARTYVHTYVRLYATPHSSNIAYALDVVINQYHIIRHKKWLAQNTKAQKVKLLICLSMSPSACSPRPLTGGRGPSPS